MIRVAKSPNAPQSLSTTKAYDGVDVLQQLEEDHHKKCYLCERILSTDFQVEHHKSKENHPALRKDWNNLFWACAYCNGKKQHHFDNILHPATVNVEEEIKHTMDIAHKQADFTPLVDTEEHRRTCELLGRLHNGTRKLRTIKEENFIEYVMGVMNNFYRLVDKYLTTPNEENGMLVREELQIEKECLGFKYWIIKSKPQLVEAFANELVWNKQ